MSQQQTPDYQGGYAQPPYGQPEAGASYVPPPAPPKRRIGVPVWVFVVAAIVILALIGGGIYFALAGHKTSTDKTFTASGTFELNGGFSGVQAIGADGSGCFGIGGYADIAPRTQMVVYNASGVSVAIGQLGPSTSSPGGLCDFTFTVSGIPADQGPYSIEISHRGKIAFNQSDAGKLALTLGNGD